MPDDLAALEARVNKGFDWLFARELTGRTGAEYEKWLSTWLSLLDDYEARLTHLKITKP